MLVSEPKSTPGPVILCWGEEIVAGLAAEARVVESAHQSEELGHRKGRHVPEGELDVIPAHSGAVFDDLDSHGVTLGIDHAAADSETHSDAPQGSSTTL